MQRKWQTVPSRFQLYAVRVLAVFFVIYAFADITVLQAYCGNESIGTPPAHHYEPQTDHCDRDSHVSNEQRADTHLVQGAYTENLYPGDNECFGNCSHVTPAFVVVKSESIPVTLTRGLLPYYGSGYLDTDPTILFHPPRSA